MSSARSKLLNAIVVTILDATATMEGGRPCKRWRDEAEEDLNIM
jgi:hypothetical protein